MTTPNPQPGQAPSGAQSNAGSSYLQQAGILAPVGGGGKSKYGLGTLSDLPVNVGGLLPVDSAQPTAEQVMEALAHADPGTIAQFQAYLYKGGFYSSGTRWADINLGVIRPDDLDAFKSAVTVAAQTGADLSDYVRRQAAWGVYTGAVSLNGTGRKGGSSAASASGGILSIEKPDPKRIGQTIDAEFKKLLGHKPSAQERAGFIAAYTNAYQQVQIDNYNRQVAAVTGTNGAGPVSGSSAAPQYLPTAPAGQQGLFNLFGNVAGNLAPGANPVDPNSWAQYLRGLPDEIASKGVVPSELSAQNRAANVRMGAQDQQFLALADQALPGMPGYSSGSGSASSTQTVMQQQAYDPQAFADEWIQNHHTAEAGAHSVTDVFTQFLNILHGGMQ